VDLTVTDLTDQLIASYARLGGINHLDGKNLPSKSAVTSITESLLCLLFPGFFGERSIHSGQLKVEIATLLDSISERLGEEIYKSLDYAHEMPRKDLSKASSELTTAFLGNLPKIRELLQTDTEADPLYNSVPPSILTARISVLRSASSPSSAPGARRQLTNRWQDAPFLSNH